MVHNLRFDLQVDNFSRFFSLEVSKMTAEQKGNIPPEILSKLFKTDGTVTEKPMSFLHQLYVLYQGIGKEIFIVVKDEDKGLGIDDFNKFQKEQKKRKRTQDAAEYFLSKGVMVLGNTELLDWLSYLNSVTLSPAYKFALSIKNKKSAKIKEVNKEFSFFCNLLMTYEGNKKRIIRQENLTMPELYVLYYLADGKEKRSTPSYVEVYRNAINASRKQILNAFKSLTVKKYIDSWGNARATSYKITSLGKEFLYKIIHKYMMS